MLYASQLAIELLYSDSCLEERPGDESCLKVQALYNGENLEFTECADTQICTLTEFRELIGSRWYSGPDSDDFVKACSI